MNKYQRELKINSWKDCLRFGLRGEQYVKENFIKVFRPVIEDYLFSNRFKFDLNNLIETKKQRNGIDGNVSLSLFEWETKTRKKDYGDILIETISVRETNKLGWFFTSKADILAYLVIFQGKLTKGFLIFLDKARKKFTKKYLYENYSKSIRIANSEGLKRNWSTENIAIPYKDFPTNSLIPIDSCFEDSKKTEKPNLLLVSNRLKNLQKRE